ncbi:hypothetical protein BT96DRAFT_870148 [Gymnopus androsaceus JB14]|uniref:Hemerythrin-like domain-containing protein n=1 Tax=Gymnopus androsaceus JB14 TaxID=1447944 RepID=A0A6A4INY8_9AGAR|nr:hypothetical protein BT96DRAFT_870148 [Gymnopus androsaceus JB14]
MNHLKLVTPSKLRNLQRSMSSLTEDRKWNKLNMIMNSFHEGFKLEFNTLYELSDGSFNDRGLSLGLYLQSAKRFNDHLTMHHTIEETYLFPILGQRMNQFSKSAEDAAHIASHRGIHEGLDKLKALVSRFKVEPSSYSPTEMRACLDSFREVLFTHLDQEVEDLRGENLKKYFTLGGSRKLSDMRCIPIHCLYYIYKDFNSTDCCRDVADADT